MYYSTATQKIGTPTQLDLHVGMQSGAPLFAGYGVESHRERGIDKPTANQGCSNVGSSDRRLPEFTNANISINWALGERFQPKQQSRGYGRLAVFR
ncbi:MAG: hypothetical protein HC856_10145 [Pseudanabaena sp. RU_4_16]|nr:hypothetical protein [Pseudanabaena sp. RU_4_16]